MISASTLYDYVHCPKRVELDAFGPQQKRDEPNAFVQLLWDRGSAYEDEIVKGLNQPFLDLSSYCDEEKRQRTLDAMASDVELIYSGRIESDGLVGVPDLLRRVEGGYVPGDIKSGAGEEGASDVSDGKPKVHYAVQLGLYIDILERLGRSAGRRGFIWDIHGQEVWYHFDTTKGPKSPDTLWDDYQLALSGAEKVLNRSLTAAGAYASSCKLCHWYNHCIDELGRLDDLTLIPFLGRTSRDAMVDSFPTIADLAAADPDVYINKGKTVFKGVGSDRFRQFHTRANLLKTPPHAPYLRLPIVIKRSEVELFFDIETDPLQDICYLHGIVERTNGDNASERFIYFFAEEATPIAEREAFQQCMAYLQTLSDAQIYYYSKYERTIYRKLQAKYPDVCSAEDVEALFDAQRAVDLYFDVVLKATEWPTRDYSIKTLASFLGFSWRDTHPSGAASIEWFNRWCREREPSMRQRILDYNEDDCRATRVLLDGIRNL